MILSHFSKDPFEFEPDRIYEDPFDGSLRAYKPNGLWLSDESAFGWREWCLDAGFQLSSLLHETKFECTTNRWLVVRTSEEFEAMERIYLENVAFANKWDMGLINWPKIKSEYGGILITPYMWNQRIDSMWYYPWDCASACVWDLATVKIV